MKKPTLKTWRRTFQLFIAVAFIIIPLLNRSRYSYVYGNFLSFHMFGIPFADPLAVLQLSVKNFNFPTLDNCIGAALPLVLAWFMGTVFCSWVCPFGLLSELGHGLNKKIRAKKYRGLLFRRKGFPIKLTIFLSGFVAFLIFSTTPILNQLSMPAWYARFFQYLYGQDVVSLCFLFIFAVLVLELVAGKRLWCRYICPQSILITLTKQLNKRRLHVVFAQDKCICTTGYERCESACSLSLFPKKLSETAEFECSNCGDCVVACRKMGKALNFSWPQLPLSLPWFKKYRYPWRRIVPWAVGAIAFAVSVPLVIHWLFDFPISIEQTPVKVASRLFDNKRLSWHGARADYYELLTDGTLICVGGEWPDNGYKGAKWQQVNKTSNFTMIFDPSHPENYTLVQLDAQPGVQVPLSIVRISNNEKKNGAVVKSRFKIYEQLGKSHKESATGFNATALLNRYADEIYVLDLRVQDPQGKIRKILTQGDVITTEVMLTNVKYWLNTPQIIVSEGTSPELPIKSRMEILFFDDHKEFAEFSTDRILDRSEEEFDDPWF